MTPAVYATMEGRAKRMAAGLEAAFAVRARPRGRFGGLRVLHRESVLHFAWRIGRIGTAGRSTAKNGGFRPGQSHGVVASVLQVGSFFQYFFLPALRPGRWGRLSAISVFLCKPVLYGAFVWAHRALKHQKRRFPARAATNFREAAVAVGLGRVLALHHRAAALHQTH
jgi:hypothetical protein